MKYNNSMVLCPDPSILYSQSFGRLSNFPFRAADPIISSVVVSITIKKRLKFSDIEYFSFKLGKSSIINLSVCESYFFLNELGNLTAIR